VLVFSAALIAACGSQEVEFALKPSKDEAGERITEEQSYKKNSGLDNSGGKKTLQVDVDLERKFRVQIITNITDQRISAEKVRQKIIETYKLPPNNPEDTEQTALCPLSIFIPPGKKATVTIEWTERWGSGVINQGTDGTGKRLGTYRVFLGYTEPCSLINQTNE
jgi:hypothetical protein